MRDRSFLGKSEESYTAGQPEGDDVSATLKSDTSRKDLAVQQGFSPVFWRFYDRKESLEGLIAYGLYKRHKWEYVSQHGFRREDERLNGYDIGDSMVEMFKERAQSLITQEKENRSLAEAIRKKSGFLASIPHNFATSLAIPLIWCVLLVSGSIVFPDARSNLGAIAIKASIWLTDDARSTASAISQGLSAQDEFANHLSIVVEELIDECDPTKTNLIAALTEVAQNQARIAQAIVDGDVFQIEPASSEQVIECAS